MNLLLIPRLALKALWQNKLRTGLTMLGIVIGVTTVIGMSSIINGLNTAITSIIENRW